MLHIAICDDEGTHLQILKDELDKNMHEMDLSYDIREYSVGRDLIKDVQDKVSDSGFDIVLMDIELAKGDTSGISIAEAINRKSPHTRIIFVSQYLAYAPDVYQTKHIYYVYKSRISELLPKALRSALDSLKADKAQILSFQSGTIQHRIPVKDIWYLERILRQTIIYTSSASYHTSEKTTALIQRLPEYFVSCHRSYVVNLSAISTIERSSITFPDGRNIPLARGRIDTVRSAFARMLQAENADLKTY